MTSEPCPPPDPEQDDSASSPPAPQRVVEVAIPNVGTFVIQSKEGGYDDEVEFLEAFGHESAAQKIPASLSQPALACQTHFWLVLFAIYSHTTKLAPCKIFLPDFFSFFFFSSWSM